MKDYLLNLKEGQNRLLLGAEQGTGKHSNDIFIIIAPNQKLNVMKWAIKEYDKIIKVEEKQTPYTTTIPLYIKKEKSLYQTELKTFVTKSMNQPGALKINNFGKNTSYMQA